MVCQMFFERHKATKVMSETYKFPKDQNNSLIIFINKLKVVPDTNKGRMYEKDILCTVSINADGYICAYPRKHH